MAKISALSVFFPAYNEEANIQNTIDKALTILPKLAREFEIIIVNDGSKDNTAKIVQNNISKNPKIKLINHKINRGYGESLKTGLYSCRYPFIAFTDSDGQFDINDLTRFIAKIDDFDLVAGFRVNRAEKGIRLFNAKAWGFLIRLLFDLNVKDIDCGFKLLKIKVINTIPRLQSTGALISAELLIKAKKAGFRITEVEVNHFPRTKGQQTGANIKVISKAFWELLKLYKKLR